MAWKDGFVIEYIPRPKSHKRRRKHIDCRNCTHCNKEEKYCKIRDISFWEGPGCGNNWKHNDNCKHFNQRKNPNKEQQEYAQSFAYSGGIKKESGESVSINNMSASKNKETKKKTISVDRFKESKRKIANANKEHLLDNDIIVLSDIAAKNFIELWDRKSEKSVCDCGGKLISSQELEVYFYVGDKLVSILMDGKRCMECNKIFIVKNLVLARIRQINDNSVSIKHTDKGQMKFHL